MGRTHYEHICRLAQEVERRTGFFVRLDWRACRIIVGPEHSPFGVWSDSVFDKEGMACHFLGWRDGVGVDDIVYMTVLANQTTARKQQWIQGHKKRGQEGPAVDAHRDEAMTRAARHLSERRKRKVYSGV